MIFQIFSLFNGQHYFKRNLKFQVVFRKIARITNDYSQ